MKANVDTTPIAKPKNSATYIDRHGVERWAENDIKVSNDNAFRLGFGEPVNYYDMVASAAHSRRASAVVDERRLRGHSEGSIPNISHESNERLANLNRSPDHWVVR